MTLIAPSLLAADFGNLKSEVQAIESAGADWLHLDVMDGHFVPNVSFGAPVIQALRPHTALPFDVHLMIAPVDPLLESFVDAGADMISVHPESGPHIHRTLQTIRSMGCKAGVALNPGTSLDVIPPLLDVIDYVLVMTVNPGFGGQKFITHQLHKIQALRKMITESDQDILIEVDGGVNAETAPLVKSAGADVLVAGTAVFGARDYGQAIAELKS